MMVLMGIGRYAVTSVGHVTGVIGVTKRVTRNVRATGGYGRQAHQPVDNQPPGTQNRQQRHAVDPGAHHEGDSWGGERWSSSWR